MYFASSVATAVEVLLQYLEAEGVEYIFGVPGSAMLPLYEALHEQSRIKHVLAKHEAGAAFMANGYARVGRRLGVCCATTGPGGTNALTGIAASYSDSIPVLLITGQTATRGFGRGSLQDSSPLGVDLVEIFKPVTKLSVMLPAPDRMPDMIRRAVRTALTGRPGPVHLSVPVDMLKQEISFDPWKTKAPRRGAAPVDKAAIAEAARLLVEAKNPCVLAGHGTNLAGAWEELVALADLLKVPVATTPKGKGAFPETHRLSLGVFGFAGHRRADSYLLSGTVDVLLVLGSGMGEVSTHTWDRRLQPSKALIQADIDACEIGKNYDVDVGIVGDLRAVLAELGAEANRLVSERGARSMSSALLAVEPPEDERSQPDPTRSPMRAQALVQEMRAVLPDDTLLLVDSGNCVAWSMQRYKVRSCHTYFVSTGLASMGHAVAAGVGAKLAAPQSPVVVLAGDAAFAMNGMEVHTAVELGLPIIWVVLNNQGHGMVYHGEKLLLGHDLNACHFKFPLDIAAMASAMGARSFRVSTIAELRAALAEAVGSSGPCVIDAIVDREEIPYALAARARTVGAAVDNSPLSIRRPNMQR